MRFVDWWSISDSGLSNLFLARRPVVGYLNRSIMAPNRLCNTSIIMLMMLLEHEHAEASEGSEERAQGHV